MKERRHSITKILTIGLACLSLSASLIGPSSDSGGSDEAPGISIRVPGGPKFIALVGQTKTATATLLPSTATDKNVVWTSSDPAKVACQNPVMASGSANTMSLQSIFSGTVTITAKAEASSSVSSSLAVTCQTSASAANILNNSNFADATKWAAASGSFTMASNVATLTCNGTSSSVLFYQSDANCAAAPVSGHEYYLRETVIPQSSNIGVVSLYCGSATVPVATFATNPASGTALTKSFVVTSAGATYGTLLFFNARSGNFSSGNPIAAMSYFVAVDLTAAFGPGHEPTASWMDSVLASDFPNSWFSGTQTLTW